MIVGQPIFLRYQIFYLVLLKEVPVAELIDHALLFAIGLDADIGWRAQCWCWVLHIDRVVVDGLLSITARVEELSLYFLLDVRNYLVDVEYRQLLINLRFEVFF